MKKRKWNQIWLTKVNQSLWFFMISHPKKAWHYRRYTKTVEQSHLFPCLWFVLVFFYFKSHCGFFKAFYSEGFARSSSGGVTHITITSVSPVYILGSALSPYPVSTWFKPLRPGIFTFFLIDCVFFFFVVVLFFLRFVKVCVALVSE